MPKDKINLHAAPTWLQYLISLSVIALVVGATWMVSGGKPAPNWIVHRLIPILGWVYIALVVYLIVYYVAVRLKRK